MWSGVLGVAGYALAFTGIVIIALAVYGIFRLPDAYLQLHAASKGTALGVMLLLLASVGTADLETMGRAVLVAAFLVLTVPVSAHAIAAAARACDEPMHDPDAVDESGRR